MNNAFAGFLVEDRGESQVRGERVDIDLFLAVIVIMAGSLPKGDWQLGSQRMHATTSGVSPAVGRAQ